MPVSDAQRLVDMLSIDHNKSEVMRKGVVASFMPPPIKTDDNINSIYYYFADNSGCVVDISDDDGRTILAITIDMDEIE
jgi:hypothetical protein